MTYYDIFVTKKYVHFKNVENAVECFQKNQYNRNVTRTYFGLYSIRRSSISNDEGSVFKQWAFNVYNENNNLWRYNVYLKKEFENY